MPLVELVSIKVFLVPLGLAGLDNHFFGCRWVELVWINFFWVPLVELVSIKVFLGAVWV